MAKGLDDLIEFLLEEIAVSGSRGVTIRDVAHFISSFYNDLEDNSRPNVPVEHIEPSPPVTVDFPLLSKIWSWLGRHPDVSIGEDRRYNKTSLTEIEIQFPNYIDLGLSGRQIPAEDGADSDGSEQPGTTPTKQPRLQKPRATKGPRISVSETRIWQAICGHPPDLSKVVPLEFELLSHIAAARSTGILQGDLVRASGQDKRSVPKRTDSLQSKGYITKEIVFRHGTRTSRLTLRKFALQNAADAEPFHKLHSLPQRGSTLRDVVRRIFDVLEDRKLISQTSLAEELSLGSSGESAILSKIIRRLEKLKCIKRVRTAVGPSATSDDLRHFVQLVRRAGAVDLDNFDTEILSLSQTVEELASTYDRKDRNNSPLEVPAAEEEDDESDEAVYKPARWNPDRLMPNVMVDAVRLAGQEGLTNLNARKMITGDFVRRQLESLLLRLSCESLIMQPQHLCHLAIVRTTVRQEGVTQYVHYSWDTFLQKATDHHLDVSDIPGAGQMMKRPAGNDAGSEVDHQNSLHFDVDEFGFPVQPPLALQLRHGQATFFELIKAAAAGDVKQRNGEPAIVKHGMKMALTTRDKSTAVSSAPNWVPNRLSHQPQQPTGQPLKRRRNSGDEKTTIGRPRKYMRGTEKFWRMQFKQARLDAGTSSDSLTKGIAQNPSAVALHTRRPAGFDEALVQALEAKLPIPMHPEDINEDWVRSTKTMIDRSSEGIYISPKGFRSDNSQKVAQIMIVKTPRLKSLDFNERDVIHPFRFLSSSASHSFPFRRYYPNLPPWSQAAPGAPKSSKRQARRALSKVEQKGKTGPRLGVFYESPRLQAPQAPELPKAGDVQLQVNVSMDTTDEETGPLRESTLLPRDSSPASMNEVVSPKDVRIGIVQAEGGSQQSNQERDRSSVTPVAPSSRPTTTETPRIRPSRNRRLTRKAIESRNSDQPYSQLPDILSEAPKVPFDVCAADSGIQNETSLDQEPEAFSAEAVSHSIDHSPTKERSADIPDSDTQKTQTPHHAQHPIPSAAERDVDASSSVGETAVTRMPAVENDITEKPATLAISEGISEVATTRSPSVAERAQESHHVAEEMDNVQQKSSFPSEADTRQRVLKASRARTESVDTGDSEEEPQPKNRQSQGKQRYFDGAKALFRRIVLQLIQETSGVVPNDPPTLKRISLPRWQEAGGQGRPLLKTIKTAIKSLTESRRLKQVIFTFRAKSGLMVKRSIIFLPHIDPLSQAVEDMKQNIINAEPTDYVPPEWRVEGYRIPLVNKRAPSRTPEVEERRPRRRRASTAASDGTIASAASQREGSHTETATPSPVVMPETPATAFLTLKVPALGSLPVVHLHKWRAECPVSALRSDTSDANPWKSSAFRPVRRRRRVEQQATKTNGRSIIWRNFPSSLEDILQLPALKLDYDAFQADDPDWQRFACEVEGVRAWEEQEPEVALSKRSKFAFINHLVPGALYAGSVVPLSVEFSKIVKFDKDGVEFEVAYPPAGSWPAFVNALNAPPNITSRIAALDETDLISAPPSFPKRRIRRSNRPSKRVLSEDDHGFVHLPAPKRRRKTAQGLYSAPSRRTGILALSATRQKLPRGAKWLQTMPEEMIYRIAIAVIVVRTLAGGMQSFINWQIVMTLFPGQKEEVIKARWNILSTRYSSDIQNLTGDFQSKYLDALQAGEVVSVTFDDIGTTDWDAIVEWALKSLDHFNLRRIAHLPADRDDLLDRYTVEFTQPKYSHNLIWGNSTTNVKEEVARSAVFGTCADSTMQPGILRYQHDFEVEMAAPALRVAKSWVLATIFTPESVFDAALAQTKLSSLGPDQFECDALLSRVLKLLQDEKIIQRKQSHQPLEQGLRVRTWEPHRKFFERFEERCMVTPEGLRRAVKYKTEILDRGFAERHSIVIDKEAVVPDGEMLAVLNLIAAGRIKVRPGADLPKTRYGLDHERIGYRTKNLDKKLLGFSIEITPTTEYLLGGPLSGEFGIRQVPVPRGQADEPMGSVPLWVDIHGNVQVSLWHKLLVGVLGFVSQMPGVTASHISRAFGFVPDEVEVELIMQWCAQSGFAKMDPRTKGYETLEWWWLCVDEAGA
ncbi:hypothetical protein FOPE_03527 [Fonsecaea pedrosoi]|nr:hypothetical protein FOPE_03527 [Fonsecaea pedrosoi]